MTERGRRWPELELAQARQGLISAKARLAAIAGTRRQLDRLDA
jgi:hypothetical protein